MGMTVVSEDMIALFWPYPIGISKLALAAHTPAELVEGKNTRPIGNLPSLRVTMSLTALVAICHLVGLVGLGAVPSGVCVIDKERSRMMPTFGQRPALAEGKSNKEIASHLDIGVRTVETHRERIMRKLDIRSVAGLTKFAIAHGMVSLNPEIPH